MEQAKIKSIFRMSEAGKCPRALSAQLLNVEAEAKPEWLSRAAEEGNWHEKRIMEELESEGYEVVEQQAEVTLEHPSFTLVGHIDGKLIKNFTFLTEIKSMSQFEFDRWVKGGFKAFPNYAAQIACYMEATGLSECLYIVKNRSSGYEDRHVLTEKPANINDIINKLQAVVEEKGLYFMKKADTDFDPQSIECRRCEYKQLCAPEPKELMPIEEAGLNAASEDWRKGKKLVAQGQELVDRAREVFEDHTGATSIFKWRYNNLAIQLVQYKESAIYPKAKLLEVFTEKQLEPASQVKEAFDQLRITDLKES